MGKGFIQLNRGDDLMWLLANDSKAFLLLTLIAVRARRNDGSRFVKLKPGEALIGDYREAGLTTEGEYRKAKERLTEYRLCTFRGTSKGTVATLCDTAIYNINVGEEVRPEVQAESEQSTSEVRAKYERGTTNNKGKKGNKGNNVNNKEKERLQRDIDFIIEHLNNVTGRTGSRAYASTGETIKKFLGARLTDGASVEDCVHVIDVKAEEWLNTDMEKYLRVNTLFRKEKFPDYLAQKFKGAKPNNKLQNDEEKSYE